MSTDDRRMLQAHWSPAEELHHAQRIGEEFRAGFETVDRIDRPAVSIFGSARVREGSFAYDEARECGRLFAQAGWAVVTGGGPGVMEAANRGCREAIDTLKETIPLWKKEIYADGEEWIGRGS